MRLFTKNVAVLTLAAGFALAGAGCEKTRDELRPDLDRTVSGDHGPQSRDLREMAAQMAPSLLACNDIVRNPNRITVVMKDMTNKTEDMPGRDMTIYVAKLTGLLNTAVASDRILFVEQQATLRNLQAQEVGNPDPFGEAGRAPTTDPRIVPQFALYGTVFSQNNGRTTYYLFQFHMTNLTTGGQSWSGEYETRTLNYN
jgi:PBP1b-binding outer membrane lipoprotein LpoB